MRPRSRLLSKRNLLLPTIREGTEETVKDLNEANTLHVPGSTTQPMSSEDYLLSICHLAHPTFPIRDVALDNLDAVHQRLRMSRPGGETARRSLRFGTATEEQAADTGRGERRRLMFGTSDPLEFLYGHHGDLSGDAGRACLQDGSLWEPRSRAHSIPRASSPVLPRERKASCPHIRACPDTCVPNTSLKTETRKESPKEVRSEEAPQRSTFKQSLISQWISDCRSAWREARLHACMLPAIAEM